MRTPAKSREKFPSEKLPTPRCFKSLRNLQEVKRHELLADDEPPEHGSYHIDEHNTAQNRPRKVGRVRRSSPPPAETPDCIMTRGRRRIFGGEDIPNVRRRRLYGDVEVLCQVAPACAAVPRCPPQDVLAQHFTDFCAPTPCLRRPYLPLPFLPMPAGYLHRHHLPSNVGFLLPFPACKGLSADFATYSETSTVGMR